MSHADTVQASSTSLITIRNLTKQFKRRSGASVVVPVDNVSLDVHEGEFLVLLGPSGCGKTTLLRCIAGLERPDGGAISIDGSTVYSSSDKVFASPSERSLSMIFQSYALWPHMTIFENIAYPLRSRKAPKEGVRQRVMDALDMVGLANLERQYPGQISGGQQQRVALARAVVCDVKVVLFDEPLSNVDAKVREQLRLELVELQRRLGFTGIYVTHDQTEAMDIAHRIAVLNNGRIEQLGTPREVYAEPSSRYVAEFIGSANFVSAKVLAVDGEKLTVTSELGAAVAGVGSTSGIAVGSEVTIMFRPQAVELVAGTASADNRWPGTIHTAKFLGAHWQYYVTVGEQLIQVWSPNRAPFAEGDEVVVVTNPKNVVALPSNDPDLRS
jgi:iron(III) transport system ATP-binding protein